MDNPSYIIKRLLGKPYPIHDESLIYNFAKLKLSAEPYLSLEQTERLSKIQSRICWKYSSADKKMQKMIDAIGFLPQSRTVPGLWSVSSQSFTFWAVQLGTLQFLVTTSFDSNWANRHDTALSFIPSINSCSEDIERIVSYMEATFGNF